MEAILQQTVVTETDFANIFSYVKVDPLPDLVAQYTA
jgi:hypothetical protein